MTTAYHQFVQQHALSVGSGMICGWGARSGSLVDAFGFVFLKPIASSSIDQVSVNLDQYGVAAPTTSTVHFSFLCQKDYKGNSINQCTDTVQQDKTTEMSSTVEYSTSVTTASSQSASFELALKAFKFGSKSLSGRERLNS